ncbi:hypothetical protein JKF63_00470 [Porcisia hertigi]|uniref:Uncharacterized protein n=1 Tax=Porcisia hertigi TaxID=2761500 RepID=A0A836HTM4_9TRYP|nr:hypothetical protein JKF63_00470 [Porcisia hertigi]
MPQQGANCSPGSGVAPSTAAPASAAADVPVECEPTTAVANKQDSARHADFHGSATPDVVEKDDRPAAAKTSSRGLDGAQPAVQEGVDKGAAADDDDDEDEDDVDSNNIDGEDSAYTAEYRSLLLRVAELEAQEQQRLHQSGFALRMAQREAKLMSEVAGHQAAYLTSDATRASRLHAVGDAKDLTNAHDESQAPITTCKAGARPSAEDVSAAVAKDARLACLVHLMEHAQVQYRHCTEAVALLRSHAGTLRVNAERQERLKVETEKLLCHLHKDAGIDDWVSISAAVEPKEERDPAHLSTPSSTLPLPFDLWHRQTSDLTTLGGTLAKVHTLFSDPECRTHMSIIATALTEVGRRCQCRLQELQTLTAAELQIEADLRQRRAHALEWSLYAAHAQQAREMQDLFSPVTLAEMRTMGLRRVLLRRRQELQNALTLVVLHHAGREGRSSDDASLVAASSSSPVRQQLPIPFSQPHAVTLENMKTVSETCARREGLRDRLLRELLYLKKCARRDLGAAWVSRAEAAALASLTAPTDAKGDTRTLEAVLEENLRRESYDSLARLVSFVASTPKLKGEQGDCDRCDISDVDEDLGDRDTVPDESAGLTSSPHSQSLPPATPLSTRVQVFSLLEALQTRANSIVSLLAENAKHWQRTQDILVEAELCASSSEDGWCRAAELLLGHCTHADTAEVLPSDTHGTEAGVHITRTSPLLLEEQKLLDSLHTTQTAIVEAMNAAIAQIHDQYTSPLECEKQAVALLIRILQLSDETGVSERQRGVTRSADLLGARTTPALESAMQLLGCTEASAQESDGASPFVTTSGMGEELRVSQVRLPQLPLRVDAVQDTMSALSAEWKNSLAAETTEFRTAVTQAQAKLDHYAQYSMAEVPSLLEKAHAEAKALRERAADCIARNSRAASLAAELEDQRTLLAKCTTTARYELTAAVKQAQQEVAALKTQVAQLQALKELSSTESLHRHEVLEAEATGWQSLIQDDRGQRQKVDNCGTSDGPIKEHVDSVAGNQWAGDSFLEGSRDEEADGGERTWAVGEEREAQCAFTSVQHEDEAEGSEIMKEEEEEAEGGADDAEDLGDEEQHFGDGPAPGDELDVRDAGECNGAGAAVDGDPEGREGDAIVFPQERLGAIGGVEEKTPLQLHDVVASIHITTNKDEVSEGVKHVNEVPGEGQGAAQRRRDESHANSFEEEEASRVPAPETDSSTAAAPRAEVNSRQEKKKRPPHPGAQRQVKQQPRQPRQHKHQQPSILGESILGQAEPGQLPPVFVGVAGNSFTRQAPPPVFPNTSLNGPVLEDNPFYTGFGFEEE